MQHWQWPESWQSGCSFPGNWKRKGKKKLFVTGVGIASGYLMYQLEKTFIQQFWGSPRLELANASRALSTTCCVLCEGAEHLFRGFCCCSVWGWCLAELPWGLPGLGRCLPAGQPFTLPPLMQEGPGGAPCLALHPLGARGHRSCGPQTRAATKPSFSQYRKWLDVSFFYSFPLGTRSRRLFFHLLQQQLSLPHLQQTLEELNR